MASTEIVKSQFGQKKAAFKAVQQRTDRLRAKLNKEKSKLEAFKEAIETVQRTVFAAIAPKAEKLRALKASILSAFQALSGSKHISKADRKLFGNLSREFEQEFQMPPQETREAREAKLPSELFSEFFVAPTEAESQDIRKVYLRLATKFHPDKSDSAAQAERLTAIMQDINAAYKRGDLAALIDIESRDDLQIGSKTGNAALDATPLEDLLQQQLNRLTAQADLLELQLERVQAEHRAIKRSPFAAAYREYQRLKIKSDAPLEAIAADMNATIAHLTRLDTALREAANTGVISDALLRELAGNIREEDALQAVLDETGMTEDELFQAALEEMFAGQKRRAARPSKRPPHRRQPKKGKLST